MLQQVSNITRSLKTEEEAILNSLECSNHLKAMDMASIRRKHILPTLYQGEEDKCVLILTLREAEEQPIQSNIFPRPRSKPILAVATRVKAEVAMLPNHNVEACKIRHRVKAKPKEEDILCLKYSPRIDLTLALQVFLRCTRIPTR